MIAVHLHPKRTRHENAPRVLALFSFRYDAHLVPDMLLNIEPMVDGWLSFDDRAATEMFTSEPVRRRALLVAAKEAGADWVLAIDPDERFERGLADAMPQLTAVSGAVGYHFALRELYAPDAYRVDGVWGRKHQCRLFRMPAEIGHAPTPLHSPWPTLAPGIELRSSGFSLYHLKMIAPVRRQGRRDLYNRLDPERQSQAIGYDYLTDETGMVLERIQEGRGYEPAFRDDNGLWMANLEEFANGNA